MNTNFEPKDARRIFDMIAKAKGSDRKLAQLARNMAAAITKADKALRRANACEDVNYHDIAQIFRERYEELSTPAARLSAQPKPLPMPDPEMEIRVVSVKFVRKDSLSARPCVFFWNDGTSNMGELFMQRFTPKQVFTPHLDEVLRPIGMTLDTDTRTGPHASRTFVKAGWSIHAGCKVCPCSPGFVLDGTTERDKNAVRCYEYDIHVHYVVQTKTVRKAS